MNKPELIVALDVPTFEQATTLVETLGESVKYYKVGSQLFTAFGPMAVRYLLAQEKEVFLDLKYHDIPNTVANAVEAAVGLGEAVHQPMINNQPPAKKKGISLCTLHTVGGGDMLQAAAERAKDKAEAMGVQRPLLLGITVLTSESKRNNIQILVLERARLAKDSGLDGVVASSQEAALIRKELGEDFLIVTPGIRPAQSDQGDQKRVTTPAEAIQNGSNFLVVGRPIVKAEDPLKAARMILTEMSKA